MVPGVARAARTAADRDWYVWSRHRRPVRRRAHHLPRHRAVELDLGPGGGPVLLAPLLLAPARPQLRQPRGRTTRCSTCSTTGSTSGVDGFRLDAVPYLFEREGTNCENLPETHEYLKRAAQATSTRGSPTACCSPRPTSGPQDVVDVLRRRRRVPHGVPLPGDAAACSWRMRREDALADHRHPRADAARSPTNAQWGLFLRNHDELTLEMVTDEERDYMYAEYAKDPLMQLNLGIRRRLAPLLDNGRGEIELCTAMLFSLPGSPVLYYGDEIGMGDNVYLGDRDGVRTPMQWTGRPQRRLLARRLRPAVPAAAHGPRLRLPGGQRRGAAAHPDVAAAVDPPLHRAAQGASRLRLRQLRGAAARRTRMSSRPPHLRRRASCSACTTWPARRRRSNSTCRGSRAWSRRRCSGGRASRASASCPTSSHSPGRGFYWFQLRKDR